MMTAKIQWKISFPKISFKKDLEQIAKNIIIPDMIKGINNKRAIDGGKLPDNEQATKDRKDGFNEPLIATGTLTKSFKYKTRGNKVIIDIASVRALIGGYLQISGIRTNSGRKYYKFFGISEKAHNRAMKWMEKKIKRIADGKR